MRKKILLILILAVGFTQVGCKKAEPESPKRLIVGQGYNTVQDAIDAAEPGDTVLLRTGTYKELVQLKDGVTLTGVSRDKVILEADAADGPIVTIDGCTDVKIEKITARQVSAADEMGKDKTGHPAVLVRNSRAKLSECRAQESGDCGIKIDGASECEVSGCITNDNKRSGIMAVGEGTKVTLEKNRCMNNRTNGIYLKDEAHGQIRQNDCQNNGVNGISAFNCSGRISIEDCNCYKNGNCGIYVEQIEFARLVMNSSRANGRHGIFVSRAGMFALIKANKCSENGQSGIYLWRTPLAELTKNICSENNWHGISVADDKGQTGLVENCCLKNQHYGIYYSVRTRVRYERNICELNGYLHFREILPLVKKKDFDGLEKIAGRMRDNRLRFANGNWQLDDFYNTLMLAADVYKWPEEKYTAILQEWIEQYPGSVTPRVALADAYRGYAWRARGSGWASEVTEEGWAAFKDNLGKALAVAAEAEKMDCNDPKLYDVLLCVGLGLGKPAEQMDQWLEKGLSIEPDYYGLYVNRATALMPRWHGQAGELEAFASRAAERTKEKCGRMVYARIAAGLVPRHESQGFETFLKHKFSYERLKQGHIEILERYPDASYYLNTYCLFACIYKDKETARELFEKIGENWDGSVWCEEEHFKKYQGWAFERGD